MTQRWLPMPFLLQKNSCRIDGKCYLENERSPFDSCLICKPFADELQWTTDSGTKHKHLSHIDAPKCAIKHWRFTLYLSMMQQQIATTEQYWTYLCMYIQNHGGFLQVLVVCRGGMTSTSPTGWLRRQHCWVDQSSAFSLPSSATDAAARREYLTDVLLSKLYV